MIREPPTRVRVEEGSSPTLSSEEVCHSCNSCYLNLWKDEDNVQIQTSHCCCLLLQKKNCNLGDGVMNNFYICSNISYIQYDVMDCDIEIGGVLTLKMVTGMSGGKDPLFTLPQLLHKTRFSTFFSFFPISKYVQNPQIW